VRNILFVFSCAALLATNTAGAGNPQYNKRPGLGQVSKESTSKMIARADSPARARIYENVQAATRADGHDTPIGSGDESRAPGNRLTQSLRQPGFRPPSRSSDIIASERSTDLGIEGVFNLRESAPTYYARVGSIVDLVVRVRNYGSVGKRVYVAVLDDDYPRITFRTVPVFVPARDARNVSLPVRVLSAPIANGYYRATITLMRSQDPRLTDVLRDANRRNNVFDAHIPVRPRRIDLPGR